MSGDFKQWAGRNVAKSNQAVMVSFAKIDGEWKLTASISDEDYKDFIDFIVNRGADKP